jgi:predicted dithiol-disulfide oxidoreductase (DUF899 family)
VPKPLHDVRFAGESPAYRIARDELLAAEIDLRRRIEAVAAMRRRLPLGGLVPEDYRFQEGSTRDDSARDVKLSELFAPDKDTLVVYSFMFGPNMKAACPACTSILDGLDGESPHIRQRVELVVVAKSPLPRILAHAKERGWRNLRLLSSAGNTFNRDYHAEGEDGSQWPALSVFVRRDERVHHAYTTELLYAPKDEGQHGRHVDSIWPLWAIFDFTPDGRGDFHPALRYDAQR